jgi:sodium/proline symporter
MIGAVGAGYELGLVAVLIPLGWFYGDYVFWTYFPSLVNKKSRDSNCSTVPEYVSYFAVGQRDSVVRKLMAMVCIVFIGLYAVAQFLAVGKAVSAFFDIPLTLTVIATAVFIVLTSAKGGLESSIPTQFVQAIIMLMTTIGMFTFSLIIAGGPVQVVSDLNALSPDILMLNSQGIWLPLGLFFGFMGTAFTFNLGTPHLLIRIMSAKTPDEAAKSRWIYIGFMQVTWISMTLFGVIMNLLLSDVVDPEQGLPMFAKEYAGPLLSGVILAGIFASITSSLDGQLLVISSSMGVDMSPGFYKRMSDKYGVRYQITVTVFVVVLISVTAIILGTNSSVFELIVLSATVLGATLGLGVLLVLLGRKTTTLAIIVAIVAALITVILWRYLGWTPYFNDALPAFIVGLFAHQMVMILSIDKNENAASSSIDS